MLGRVLFCGGVGGRSGAAAPRGSGGRTLFCERRGLVQQPRGVGWVESWELKRKYVFVAELFRFPLSFIVVLLFR
jgi:hypothetical protein